MFNMAGLRALALTLAGLFVDLYAQKRSNIFIIITVNIIIYTVQRVATVLVKPVGCKHD